MVFTFFHGRNIGPIDVSRGHARPLRLSVHPMLTKGLLQERAYVLQVMPNDQTDVILCRDKLSIYHVMLGARPIIFVSFLVNMQASGA